MQITFIHDFHRAEWDGGTAERNNRWLYALLAPALRHLGHQTTRIGLAYPAVQSLLARPHPAPAPTLRWPILFSHPDAVAQLGPILPLLSQAALVVGFELSPNLMCLLHAAGIAFVDIAIDPVRFAPDLFLALRTNDPNLAHALAQRAAAPAAIARHARRLVAPGSAALRATARKTLFVGQTDVDAALISGSRLGTVTPHLQALRARFGDGEHLLLKPHPYGRAHQDMLALHQAFPNARLVNDNIYALLGSGAVSDVVTLSSGVATEAPFFGVPASSLLHPDTAQIPFASRRIRLPVQALSPGLWASLTRTPGRPRPSSLRARLALAWAYPPPAALPSRHIEPGDLTNRSAVRVFGWSYPEPTGCWTDGPLATLVIDPPTYPCSLTLRCSPYLPPGAPSLDVTLDVRGADIALQHLTFHTRRRRQITIPLPSTEGPIEIALHIANPRRPADHGSNDGRALGLHVTGIHVRPARPDRLSTWVPSAARAMAASVTAALMGG